MQTPLKCARCGRDIGEDPGLALDLFEGMHWICFHLEFEHYGDSSRHCEEPGCARAFTEARALGFGAPAVPHVVQVAVKLSSALHDTGRGETLTGYFRVFGVTAPSERELRAYVTAETSDGEVEWNEFAVLSRGYSSLPSDLVALGTDPAHEGIWYVSGRVFF